MTPETPLTDEQIAELLAEDRAPHFRIALLELQARRAAEKKEWRAQSLDEDRIVNWGPYADEGRVNALMEEFPNHWRKQYRIAAGPWIDAELARKEQE